MKPSPMRAALEQIEKVFPNLQPDEYLEFLAMYPPNEWHRPTRRNENAFCVFTYLSEINLICKKSIPQYKKGILFGVSQRFFYNLELDYSNLD